MLRIIQNRSVAQAKSYYTQADYYSEGQELAGDWGGLGAARLGLSGEIRKEDFQSLCDNLNPQTGERLTPRTKDDRTVGYDFNFHVPKGISVAYMLNRDERILDAFRESVRETMEELEEDAKTRVRVKNRDDERITGNLIWGQFVHLTARPVDGVPDPHLHAHCFVFNQTYDQQEQRWKAVQFRDIKRDAPYFEAAFYARFAKRLNDLGYPIERKGKQWDLAGMPRSVSKKFSRRTEQVEKHAADKGVKNARKKDQLGAKTREKKDSELTMSELRSLWRERLSGEEQSAIGGLGRAEPSAAQHAPEAAMRHAVEHCFERNSVVARREVLAEALRYGLGDVTPSQAKAALPAEGVIVRSWGGRDMATTPHVLAEEQAMLVFARKGKQRAAPLNPKWKIKREWLNAGQQGAVRHVLQSSDIVTVIKGMAGTGKTSLMQEAVEAIEAAGHQVFTFAPSAEASRNVLRSEGFANATTVAELLASEKLQLAAKGQVLWIDESGLLGTRQLKQVFDLAQRIEARVILSGDWRQHGSVERGAAMRLLEQEGGIKPAVVSSIQRQSGVYRDAVAMLAKGDTEAGFDMLDQLGWIEAIDDEARPAKVAQEYVATLISDKKAPLVVSPTHAEGERITEAIREELKAKKLLGAEDRFFARLMPRHLTEAERADAAMYEDGDVIVFHQNVPGHRKGERIVVNGEPDPELLKYAKRFQTYRVSELPLAVGDCVRFTANGQTRDGKHRLNNGAMFRIGGFTKAGDIRLENGWIVGKEHGFIAPGYVVTSHASQGKTYDEVIIAESAESLAAASREQFYVSVSRGKRKAVIFTDDKEALREAVAKSSSRLAATELVRHFPILGGPQHRAASLAKQAAAREEQPVKQQAELAHERG